MTDRRKHMQQEKGGPQQSLLSHSDDLHSTTVSTSSPKLNVTLCGPDCDICDKQNSCQWAFL